MKKFAALGRQGRRRVEFVEGPPGSIVSAVRDGRADVGVVFEWDASIAAQPGCRWRTDSPSTVGPILLTSVMVKRDYLASNAGHGAALLQRTCRSDEVDPRGQVGLCVGDDGGVLLTWTSPVVEAGCARLLATRGLRAAVARGRARPNGMRSSSTTSLAGTVRKAVLLRGNGRQPICTEGRPRAFGRGVVEHDVPHLLAESTSLPAPCFQLVRARPRGVRILDLPDASRSSHLFITLGSARSQRSVASRLPVWAA
jgi:hypothetical protein